MLAQTRSSVTDINLLLLQAVWIICPDAENCHANYIHPLLDILKLLIVLPIKSAWTHQKLVWFSLTF